MRKTIGLVIVGIVAVLLSVCVWQLSSQINGLNTQIAELQTQNRDLQNQTSALQEKNSQLEERLNDLLEQQGENYSSPVKITQFIWVGGFNPIVGVTLYHPVNVTITNEGATTANGLSLGVNLINKYDGSQIGTGGGTNIEALSAGETRDIRTGAYTSIGTSLADAACVVTLRQGDKVLDELVRPLS
jgi:outer membrane murein-binding lipoprotein Lpp